MIYNFGVEYKSFILLLMISVFTLSGGQDNIEWIQQLNVHLKRVENKYTMQPNNKFKEITNFL